MAAASLFDIDVSALERVGYGSYGEAYAYEDRILKVTRHIGEHRAALRLIADPQPWSCAIYASEASELEWRILKARVELIQFEEPYHKEPGTFWGIPHRENGFADRASCPVEFCQGMIPPNDHMPCAVEPITPAEMQRLLRLYENRNAEQAACFRWFIETYWQVRAFGFTTIDLYCNIGRDASGEFVYFDMMQLEPQRQ